MNLDIIAVSKVDGGYLVSAGDDCYVRTTYDDISFLIRELLDNPKPKKIKTFPFSSLQDLDAAYRQQAEQEPSQPPEWVGDILKQD